MNFNTSKLRGRIVEKFGTIGKFAEKTSRGKQFVSNVLHCKAMLTQKDMDEWIKLLEIPEADIALFFFN
jgi:hypothetical protein